MEKWYKGVYRRNLVDMHIADWSDEFLSKFDVDDYYKNLVQAKIQSPMIYLQVFVIIPQSRGKHTLISQKILVL